MRPQSIPKRNKDSKEKPKQHVAKGGNSNIKVSSGGTGAGQKRSNVYRRLDMSALELETKERVEQTLQPSPLPPPDLMNDKQQNSSDKQQTVDGEQRNELNSPSMEVDKRPVGLAPLGLSEKQQTTNKHQTFIPTQEPIPEYDSADAHTTTEPQNPSNNTHTMTSAENHSSTSKTKRKAPIEQGFIILTNRNNKTKFALNDIYISINLELIGGNGNAN